MIDILKDLEIGASVTFLETAASFIERPSLEIQDVRWYLADDAEVVIVDFDEHTLIAHTFDGHTHYYIYQIDRRGDVDELTEDGYVCLEEDEFRDKITLHDDDEPPVRYRHSGVGAVYGLTTERGNETTSGEASVCEYYTIDDELSHLWIENVDGFLTVSRGFEIEENWVVI